MSFVALAVLAAAGTCSVAVPAAEASSDDVAVATLGFELFLGLLACAGAALISDAPARQLGLAPSRVRPAQAVVLILGTLALSGAIDSSLDLTELREHSALAEIDAHLIGIRGARLALALLAFAAAPGVAEELLCRGLVQRVLERRLGGPLAIVLAASFFGVLHVDPIHAVSAGILGLYLGVICWLAGSVRTAILCHIVNNCVAVVAAAYEIRSPPEIAILVGSAASGLGLWWVWRRLGGPPTTPREPRRSPIRALS